MRDILSPRRNIQALLYLLYEKANYVVHCLFERVFALLCQCYPA